MNMQASTHVRSAASFPYALAMTGIPQSAQRFLRRYVTSVSELDVLLLLAKDSGREWTCQLASSELQASPEAVRSALEQLTLDHLLEAKTVAEETHYRFKPIDDSVHAAVQILAQLQDTSRAALIEFIHGRTMRP